jgi:hypothetical protein
MPTRTCPRRLPAELHAAGFDPAPRSSCHYSTSGKWSARQRRLIGVVGSFIEGRDGWTAVAVGEWRDDLGSLRMKQSGDQRRDYHDDPFERPTGQIEQHRQRLQGVSPTVRPQR